MRRRQRLSLTMGGLEGSGRQSAWKTRIAAPKQTGFSRWHGDEAARRAVTNNRARLKSGVAREAFKLRAEIVERCFAHNLDRGGMRRTWLRVARECAQAIPAPRRRPQSIVTDAPAHRRRHPAGGRGGRIWRYFRSAHAHRGHAGGTGGLATAAGRRLSPGDLEAFLIWRVETPKNLGFLELVTSLVARISSSLSDWRCPKLPNGTEVAFNGSPVGNR